MTLDPGIAIKGLEHAYGPFLKASKWVVHKTHLALFRLRDRKPPLNEPTAIGIAYFTLGGSISKAISYRNINTKQIFIACIRKESDEAFEYTVHILEKMGGAFIELWCSDSTSAIIDHENFNVIDINNDGVKELVYEVSSYGSGAGSRSLYVYSTEKKELYEITEYDNYSDAAAPPACPIIMNLGDDERLKQAIIRYASTRGYLKEPEPIDFDNPRYAIQRWHKENGIKRNGVVKIHIYSGEPVYGASISAELDSREIRWVAYFKGPLYGVLKDSREHFIAYSPAWVYEWVNCLAFDGSLLWGGIHCRAGLLAFDYRSKRLYHYISFRGVALPDTNELSIVEGQLIIDTLAEGRFVLPLNNYHDFETCKPYINCRVFQPHTPEFCSDKDPDFMNQSGDNAL